MTPRLVFVSRARSEYTDAAVWNENERAGLGLEFRAAVRSTLRAILERPASIPLQASTGLRRALVSRFPYAIHFLDRPGEIVVLAIYHAKRDPRLLEGLI